MVAAVSFLRDCIMEMFVGRRRAFEIFIHCARRTTGAGAGVMSRNGFLFLGRKTPRGHAHRTPWVIVVTSRRVCLTSVIRFSVVVVIIANTKKSLFLIVRTRRPGRFDGRRTRENGGVPSDTFKFQIKTKC